MLVMLALAALLFVPSSSAQERLSEGEIIQAFLNCPEIIQAQKKLSAAEPSAPKIVLENSGCGVAGCQYTALVAQKFESRRVNPFVTHLLGYVHVGPKGNITLVERVQMVPFKDLEGSDRTDD
jgi:hypothetical protein